MKNLFARLLTAALCLALLFSSLGLTSFAATAETADSTESDEAKPLPTVEPLAVTQTQKGYINAGVVMKIGSDNILNKGTKQAIFTSDDGSSFGKPIKSEGTVYIPLAVAASYAGGSLTALESGKSFRLTLGGVNYSITILNTRVSSGNGAIDLEYPPIYNAADNGKDFYPLIAVDDINKLFPAIHVFSNSLGLIILTKNAISLDSNNSTDLSYMLELMRSFVFNFLSTEDYYDVIKENTNDFSHPYIYANQDQFDFMNDVYEGRKEDEVYKKWLVDKVDYVDRAFFNLFTELPLVPAITDDPNDYDFTKKPEYYTYLAFELTNYLDCGIKNGQWVTDTDFDYGQFPVVVNGLKSQPAGYVGAHWNGGYEWSSGRSDDSREYAEKIQELALVYQITREDKYAILAWEMIESLMKWDHWAHGHFLNCAQIAGLIGCTYDWLYNVWNDMGYDTNKIVQAIYEKCVFYGYIVSLDLATHEYCEYFDEDVVRESSYGTTEYNRIEINWNAVCTSGLVVGMLAIIGAEDKNGVDKINTGTTIDFTTTKGHGIIKGGKDPITKKAHTHTQGMNIFYWLLESNLYSLAYYGLKQYAPDGSFIEGPGYWSYATNNLAKMLWAIDTATGDDQGWHDFWGMDQTFYFAVQTEYPSNAHAQKYVYWAFHDCSYSVQSTAMFFFASEMLDDDNLAAIRLNQIQNGKSVSSTDILGYKERYLSLETDSVNLSRDYLMLSINGATTRSSWEKGCIFTGLIGNTNGDTAHGQTDSGAFTYASKNYTWFVDLGADNYDVAGYFTNGTVYRHTYYRNSAEGANTLCMTSQPDALPAGQYFYGGYYLMQDTYQSTENGMVIIQNGANAFSSYASSAYRGLLFTNDRSTVVIQDQAQFAKAETVYWVAHTKVIPRDITISADGRTAILKAIIGNGFEYLRVSIVSPDTTLKFQVIDAGVNDYLLSKTHRAGWSTSNGGETEYSRNDFYRLVIKAQNTMSFNCAVVIENIEDPLSSEAVGYTWGDMFDWDADRVYKQTTPESSDPGVTPPADEGDTIKMSNISSYANTAKQLIDANYAFTNRMSSFFDALCQVYKTLEVYPPESFSNRVVIREGYEKYLAAKAQWDSYIGAVNRQAAVCRSLARGWAGA